MRVVAESNVRCKTDGEKEGRGPSGDVGIEGNSPSDGKGEWSEMFCEMFCEMFL